MEHNTTCFREGVDLLLRIHFTQPYNDTVWGLPPATVARCVWAGCQEVPDPWVPHSWDRPCEGGGRTHSAHAWQTAVGLGGTLLMMTSAGHALSLRAPLAAHWL